MTIDAIIGLVSLGMTIIGALVVSANYIAKQVDKKLSIVDFDAEHRELMSRVRKLELWAAKKGYTNG